MFALAVIFVALCGAALCGFLLGLYIGCGKPVVLMWNDPMRDETPSS